MKSEAPKLRVVLYEGHGSRPVASGERFAIFQTLLERGYAVTSVRGTSTADGGRERYLFPSGAAHHEGERYLSPVAAPETHATLLVLGHFTERPPDEAEAHSGAKVFFRALPVGDGETQASVGSDGAAVVADLVETIRASAQAGKSGAWKPWFPVIDYGRCTNCMQCLSFCLFDVYGVSTAEKITVQNPSNCKTDCPACSRVCPEVAILFPKYKAGPINGDEVNQGDVEREKMKVDISALLGGDIYAALRERSARAKTRFAKERDDQRAIDERRRCLIKLQQELDIPPEVLAALPTQDQIQEKAARALAAAQERKV